MDDQTSAAVAMLTDATMVRAVRLPEFRHEGAVPEPAQAEPRRRRLRPPAPSPRDPRWTAFGR
jgi:hypothetical protein